jgi:hypothetical protein
VPVGDGLSAPDPASWGSCMPDLGVSFWDTLLVSAPVSEASLAPASQPVQITIQNSLTAITVIMMIDRMARGSERYRTEAPEQDGERPQPRSTPRPTGWTGPRSDVANRDRRRWVW